MQKRNFLRFWVVVHVFLNTVLATLEAELQELVDRLDRVSRKYSLLINVDKTKVMASDGIACRMLIQNEQLEQMDTFPYLGSLISKDVECTAEFRTRRDINSSLIVLLSPRKRKIMFLPALVCLSVCLFVCLLPR